MRILALGDAAHATFDVAAALDGAGVEVCAHEPDLAASVADSQRFSMIVLQYPNISDALLEVVASLRARDARVPILLLTREPNLQAKLRAFERGIDDCVPCDCDPAEFACRARALVRRAQVVPIRVGPIVIDEGEQRAFLDSQPLDLTAREFTLLRQLALRAGEVVTRQDIHTNVWRSERPADSNVIEVHVGRLRNKLGTAASHLRTVRGVGYSLFAPPLVATTGTEQHLPSPGSRRPTSDCNELAAGPKRAAS
jgi:DNA-binding response OmpR family regulator